MCREQLVKLRPRVNELTAEGAAVLGISNDTPQQAARLTQELGLTFPILTDVRTEVVRAFAMYGDSMGMPEMGYVVIDKQGRIRTRQVDRRFGENVDSIVRAVRDAKRQA